MDQPARPNSHPAPRAAQQAPVRSAARPVPPSGDVPPRGVGSPGAGRPGSGQPTPARPAAPPRPQSAPGSPGTPSRPYAPAAARPVAPARPQAGNQGDGRVQHRPYPSQQAPARAYGPPSMPPFAPPSMPPSMPPFLPPSNNGSAAPQAAVVAPPAAAGSEPLGPPPRPHRRKIGRWVALLVIAGGLGGAAWYGTHTAPASTAVGDCVAQTGSDSLVKVGCGDQGAQFRVDGRLEDKTQIDASLDACAPFPKATSAYWEGENGKPGLVLCLEPVVAVPAAK